MVVTLIMASSAVIAMAAVALILGIEALTTMVIILVLVLGFFSYLNL